MRVVRFEGAGGETVQCYMSTPTEGAGFAAITFANMTGAVLGNPEQNFKNILVSRTRPSHLAAFVASGASLINSPVYNRELGSASSAWATLTVTATIVWTAIISL